MYRSAPVYERILVGFDDRAEGMDALHLAALFARADGAELIAASVFPPTPDGADEARLEQDRDFLSEKARQVAPGVDLTSRVVIEGSPAKALQELAEAEGTDLIVLGSSHRGPLGRIFPGSTANRLLGGAPCAIAVAPRGFAQREDVGLAQIAVGYDGQEESGGALRVAEDLALAEGASLVLLAVAEPPPLGSGYAVSVAALTGALQEKLNQGVAKVSAETRAKGEMLHGGAGPALVAWATEMEPDLIVVGSRGYGPLRRVLLGSAAVGLMREAPCPVLVLPRRGAAAMPAAVTSSAEDQR